MKYYNPTPREIVLNSVLQFDSQYMPILKPSERWSINYERAKIMGNELPENFKQPKDIEDKINQIIQSIATINWEPFETIKYV